MIFFSINGIFRGLLYCIEYGLVSLVSVMVRTSDATHFFYANSMIKQKILFFIEAFISVYTGQTQIPLHFLFVLLKKERKCSDTWHQYTYLYWTMDKNAPYHGNICFADSKSNPFYEAINHVSSKNVLMVRGVCSVAPFFWIILYSVNFSQW